MGDTLEKRVGDFFSQSGDCVGFDQPGAHSLCWENGCYTYETASDVRKGPNVYTYVVQNPWTKFDPLGLYYDGEQFDNDGYMKPREDNDDNRDYNDRVGQFNKEWAKARETPTGSAMHEYITNQSDVKFQVDLMATANKRGEPAYHAADIDAQTGKGSSLSSFVRTDDFDMELIAHEFFHGIQSVEGSEFEKNNPIDFDGNSGDVDSYFRNRGSEKHRGSGDVFVDELGYSVYDVSDLSAPQGRGFSPSLEAQAMRIQNNVRYEYSLKNDKVHAKSFTKYGWARNTYSGWEFKNPMGTKVRK